MIACYLEGRSDLTLIHTLPHQRLVPAAAQGQSKGIEQDRLACAGLTGKDGKLVGKVDVEPVDQNDVADRKSGEHGVPSWQSSCPELDRAYLLRFAYSKTTMAGTSPANTMWVNLTGEFASPTQIGRAHV